MAETRIVSDPEVLAGKPVIAGTRISVALILEWLAAGRTPEQIRESYPHLPKDAVSVALSYAAGAFGGGMAPGGEQVREAASAYTGRVAGRPTVRVDAEEYETLRYRLDLLQGVVEGLADSAAGRVVPHEEAMAELLGKYPG